MDKMIPSYSLLQAKAVTQTITRISVNPEYWPFSVAEYKLPYTFKMPTSEHEFCTSLAKLCKHSMAPRSPEREVLLYEVLGEIFLLLWCEYSANQPPAAVIFEPFSEPISVDHEKA